MTRPKNPREPRQQLTISDADIASYDRVLYRIHRVVGRHRETWSQLREWGPALDCRWDPHPEPAGMYPDDAVMYTAGDYVTAFGEVFQRRRAISLSATKALVAWVPLRTLRLLDLTDTWAVRNGAAGSLDSAPHRTCRSWAHRIHRTWPDLDGLLARSTITLRPAITLFAPVRDAMPQRPAFSRPLDHPEVAALARSAAGELGWPVRRA